MVKLWIDNQEVNVEKGTTILDAAASRYRPFVF